MFTLDGHLESHTAYLEPSSSVSIISHTMSHRQPCGGAIKLYPDWINRDIRLRIGDSDILNKKYHRKVII